MIALLLLCAWAGGPAMPLPARGIDLQGGEVRVGHAIYQWPAIASPRTQPTFPRWNISAHAGMLVGGRRVALELAMQHAIGQLRFSDGESKWSYGWWRTEPRLGVRYTHPTRVFGALGGALTLARTGVVPAGWVTVGWAGRGEHVRPMVALEGRVAPLQRDYYGCGGFESCSVRNNPGGAGVHLSVGLSLGDGGNHVRRGATTEIVRKGAGNPSG